MQYDLITCRRTNYLQAAMVQAAIAIQESHGREVAIAILLAEQIPTAVINRVLEGSSAKRQWPYKALEHSVSQLGD